MAPSAVNLLRLVEETVSEIKYREAKFTVDHIDGSVFFQVCLPFDSPGFNKHQVIATSKPYFVGERSTRVDVARLAFEAIKTVVCVDVMEKLRWKGIVLYSCDGA